MSHDLYPSVKPLKVVKEPEPKAQTPKGMVRASTYERRMFQQAFKKEKGR